MRSLFTKSVLAEGQIQLDLGLLAPIEYIKTLAEMKARAQRSDDNAYMIDEQVIIPDGGIEYMDLYVEDEAAEYFIAQLQQSPSSFSLKLLPEDTPEGKIIAAAVISKKPHSFITFEGLSVDATYKDQGYEEALLRAVMSHAKENYKVLHFENITADELVFLRTLLPEIHHNEFQGLSIKIQDNPPNTGKQKYRMPRVYTIEDNSEHANDENVPNDF